MIILHNHLPEQIIGLSYGEVFRSYQSSQNTECTADSNSPAHGKGPRIPVIGKNARGTMRRNGQARRFTLIQVAQKRLETLFPTSESVTTCNQSRSVSGTRPSATPARNSCMTCWVVATSGPRISLRRSTRTTRAKLERTVFHDHTMKTRMETLNRFHLIHSFSEH